MQIKTALISVSNKEGIVQFAKELSNLKIEILASGGTAKLLKENGIEVIEISSYTGFPEMLDGRVKTLHPKIHSGILAIRENKEHMQKLKEHSIKTIDLVVVNLYPFEKTIEKENVALEEVIENIDIGGPTMIRSSAKNYKDVAVVVNPKKYGEILKELKEKNELSEETKRNLMLEAFQHTSGYDAVIYNYLFSKFNANEFPNGLRLNYKKVMNLRYGENPEQKATFYKNPSFKGISVANCTQLHGKELSYNNILDIDSALDILMEFERPTSVVIKHTNPCGVASADEISVAFKKSFEADSLSAFGGIVGLNRVCDERTAEEIKKHFIEVVVCPEFEKKAIEILSTKKDIRLLKTGKEIKKEITENKLTQVKGGMLCQSSFYGEIDEKNLNVVSNRKPTAEEIRQMLFAWKIVKHVKSNSVLIVNGEETVGIGAGQMSRVVSSMIACYKAGKKAKNGVVASDAFFPFRDGVDEVAKVGITAIIQPGGSVRDGEVIQACNEHNIAMVFTGKRVFKH